MIAKPVPVEQAHADVEGGDMCSTKERYTEGESGNGRKSQQ
jgi:hypothetical protein